MYDSATIPFRRALVLFTSILGSTLPAVASTNASVSESYGKLPLQFEANRGQTHKDVRFLSRGPGYSLYLTADEAVLVLSTPTPDTPRNARDTRRDPKLQGKSVALRMSLVGAARKPQVTGLDELPGKANYFIGKDRSKWRTNAPTYAKVQYRNVYPGIDLVYYGNQRQLEYDFVVAPGADPKTIALRLQGARKLEIDAEGNLVLRTAGGDICQHKPIIYQEIDGVRQAIDGSYVRKGANRVGFQVAAYDTTRPLIIDPVLSYSTYLGGSGGEKGLAIAVDRYGNAYVTGVVSSTDFPTTSGAYQTNFGGGTGLGGGQGFDAFVTKLDPTGSALVYSTYLGGSDDDQGLGIAVDTNGNAYVTGSTFSANFPTTAGSFQPTYGGVTDAFVTKLDPTGSALIYSTYLGGSSGDEGNAIAVDAGGCAYVTGIAGSDFPTTPGAVEAVGAIGAFVTKLDPSGSALAYSTYLGGNRSGSNGSGIAVDAFGNAYVTGFASSGYPTTPGAFQRTFNPPAGVNHPFTSDAFVTKLNPTGTGLVYSTYLGGSEVDFGTGIAVDVDGNAYVTGFTASADFPVTPGPQPLYGGGFDAFVTKLQATGSALAYSTYLGGSGEDRGHGIAVDAHGSAYVTGQTASINFPTTSGAFQTTFGGGNAWFGDAFVTKLNATGLALDYSSFLGGSGDDVGTGIAVDAVGNAYVTGHTWSDNFPTTTGAFQATGAAMINGSANFDAFIAKFGDDASLPAPGTTRSEESAATEIGFWTTYGAETGTFSGGTIVASNVAASTAMFTFTGTAVSWIGVKCNVCGIAAVSIDGGAPTTVNTAGPNAPGSLSSESVFSASGLAAATHTMVITVTGMSSSGGAYVAVDAFDVTAGSATSPLLPPVVLPPPPVVAPPLPPVVGL